MDGTRLLWSLLTNQCSEVKACTAWVLRVISHEFDSAKVVRSFVNGVELLIYLIRTSKNNLELAATRALIAEVAKDNYNLAILTDYLVVLLLAKLVHTNDELLQECVAAAIASCYCYAKNKQQFGESENGGAHCSLYGRNKCQGSLNRSNGTG